MSNIPFCHGATLSLSFSQLMLSGGFLFPGYCGKSMNENGWGSSSGVGYRVLCPVVTQLDLWRVYFHCLWIFLTNYLRGCLYQFTLPPAVTGCSSFQIATGLKNLLYNFWSQSTAFWQCVHFKQLSVDGCWEECAMPNSYLGLQHVICGLAAIVMMCMDWPSESLSKHSIKYFLSNAVLVMVFPYSQR